MKVGKVEEKLVVCRTLAEALGLFPTVSTEMRAGGGIQMRLLSFFEWALADEQSLLITLTFAFLHRSQLHLSEFADIWFYLAELP